MESFANLTANLLDPDAISILEQWDLQMCMEKLVVEEGGWMDVGMIFY